MAVVLRYVLDGKHVYTALSTDTLPPAPEGSEARITDVTGRIDVRIGEAWVQTTTNGARNIFSVGDLPPGNQHIREINALDGTAQTLDWSALANGIKAVALFVLNEAQTTADTNAAAICIDPPNAATRNSWLTAGNSLAADSMRLLIPAAKDPVVLTFRDSAGNFVGVDYIGIKRDLGSDALRIIAIGVEN